MSETYNRVRLDEDSEVEQSSAEAHLASLDAQQLAALCATAREGIRDVVQFSIEPEPEE